MLLFADSFDHYTSQAHMLTKWNSTNLTPSAVGRFGTNGLRAPWDNFTATKNFANKTTVIAGCGYRVSSFGTVGSIMSFLDMNTGFQMELRLLTTGQVRVTRNGTTLATSSIFLIAGAYNSIEFKVTISSTVGAYEVRLNGTNILSASGVNTQGQSNAFVNQVRLGGNTNGATFSADWDDFYLCDDTGAQYNDFLGDVRVNCLFPNGEGGNSAWVPNSGSVHNDRVREVAPDDDTTYLSSLTPGDRDTWTFGDLASTSGTVKGIQIVPYLRKDDAGVRTVAPVSRIGGVNYDHANLPNLPTTYVFQPQVVELSPATGVAWTVSEINGAEWGIKEVA